MHFDELIVILLFRFMYRNK